VESIESLPTLDTAKKLGLLPEEYDRIQEILGRKPNFTELSIFLSCGRNIVPIKIRLFG